MSATVLPRIKVKECIVWSGGNSIQSCSTAQQQQEMARKQKKRKKGEKENTGLQEHKVDIEIRTLVVKLSLLLALPPFHSLPVPTPPLSPHCQNQVFAGGTVEVGSKSREQGAGSREQERGEKREERREKREERREKRREDTAGTCACEVFDGRSLIAQSSSHVLIRKDNGMLYLISIVVVLLALGYLLKTTLELVEDGGELSAQGEDTTKNTVDISTNVISIYFGSQTGTAENYAHEIAHFLRKRGYLVDVEDLEYYSKSSFLGGTTSSPRIKLFLLATYGEGEPTDNSKTFCRWIKQEQSKFVGVKYAVLGLGNSQYEHYNTIAKEVDKTMEERGAERLCQLHLCDAAGGGMDEEFSTWANAIRSVLDTLFRVKARKEFEDQLIARRKNFYIHTFMSEKEAQNFTANPPLSSAKIDHVKKKLMTVRAQRDVATFVLLDVILSLVEIAISFKSLVTEDLFTWNWILTQDWLAFLAELATSDDDRRNLNWSDLESLPLFSEIQPKGYKNIVDVLVDHKSVNLTLENTLRILPRVQPRYYSISSSSSSSPKQAHITLKVEEEAIDRTGQSMERGGERRFQGTCSSFLSRLDVGSAVQAQLRRSPFKLPKDMSTPIILVRVNRIY
eukprot:747285-Hanusia_phi.AAC.3